MGASMTKLESLERLARLKESGALTDEEFASEKAKILARDDAPPANSQAQSGSEPRGPSPRPSELDPAAPIATPGRPSRWRAGHGPAWWDS